MADPAGPGAPPAGRPRADGDGIAADIATRAGLVTVVFTGRGHARATPADGRAFTYRGRAYAGSVFLSAPDWRGSPGLGMALYPAGSPAGRGVAGTIAAIIGAAVAAHLRQNPEILDQARQARDRAEQARAVRDLELLTTRITAAERQLAGLRAEETALRAIAGQPQPAQLAADAASPPPPSGPPAGAPDRAGPQPPARADPAGLPGRPAVFDVTAGGLRHRLAPGVRAARDLTALTSGSLTTDTPCCGRRITIPVPGPDQARPAFCCHCRALFTVRLIQEEPDGYGDGEPPHVAVFEARLLDVTVASHRAGRWEPRPRGR